MSVWADGVWACWADGVWEGMGGGDPEPEPEVVVRRGGSSKRRRKVLRYADYTPEEYKKALAAFVPIQPEILEEENEDDEILIHVLMNIH